MLLFKDCTSATYNAIAHNTVMLICCLLGYCVNYAKKIEKVYQYARNKPNDIEKSSLLF